MSVGVEGNLLFAHLKGCVSLWCLSLMCASACVRTCICKTESLWPHEGVNTPRSFWMRLFDKCFAFIVVDHPPWERMHRSEDGLLHTRTHTHTFNRLALFSNFTLILT